MSSCCCGLSKNFEDCCQPYLEGKAWPSTPEALMRARYSAYVTGAISFLHDSLHPDKRGDHDEAMARAWAEESEWLGLEILATDGGGDADATGVVEFVARYARNGQIKLHRERSFFVNDGGQWFFEAGELIKAQPVVRAQKTGRNELCPCGSGLKYKKCCG